MTNTRKTEKLKIKSDTKVFFKRRESEKEVIQNIFKPRPGAGDDAMEQVILKYTNVIPK